MIKKIILWLWLSVISFIGFTNAKVQDVWLLKYPSTLDQNFSIWFLKGGGVLTDFLWSAKSVVALDTNTIFWWATNWMPYFYSEWVNTIQWFFDRYFSCDALTTIDTLPENCQLWWMIDYSWDLQSIKEIFKGFFSKVKQDDLAYYNYINDNYVGGSLRYTEQWLEICWSSEEIWKSLCFRGWTCNSNSVYHCNWYLGGWQLTNSQNLSNLSFWNVSNSRIWYAPWQNWYDWQFEWSTEWSTEWFINNQLTWDYTYADCTWKDILIALEAEWYNKYICYWWLDNFNLYDSSLSYNPIAWTWLSISQIWAWSWSRAWDNFPEWFTFWNWLYSDTSENNYNAMWESYPAVYRTYFQLYNAYKWSVLDPRTVLEYCQLRTLTWNQLNNSAWWYFKPVCETVVREKQTWLWDCRVNWTLYSWCEQNPQVAIWTNWNWVWNMSWVTAQSDWLNFIQNFFNLAKSNLLTNYSWTPFGILPSYIVIFLIALILFRFISH